MQISGSIMLFVACATGACTATAGPPVPEQPSPQAPAAQPAALLPPGVDLTGNWATGSEGEPATARITQHVECAYNPSVWIIRQTGNSIEAWAIAASYNQGIAVKGPGPARVVASPGTISGLDVIIDDGESRYMLRFDTGSGHLRGTRNGHPFWAARQTVIRTQGCPGFP